MSTMLVSPEAAIASPSQHLTPLFTSKIGQSSDGFVLSPSMPKVFSGRDVKNIVAYTKAVLQNAQNLARYTVCPIDSDLYAAASAGASAKFWDRLQQPYTTPHQLQEVYSVVCHLFIICEPLASKNYLQCFDSLQAAAAAVLQCMHPQVFHIAGPQVLWESNAIHVDGTGPLFRLCIFVAQGAWWFTSLQSKMFEDKCSSHTAVLPNQLSSPSPHYCR